MRAFSSQVLASIQELKLNINQVNQWGAIASGHPYSASGVALITRLLNMTHWKRGVATMGIGGNGECDTLRTMGLVRK